MYNKLLVIDGNSLLYRAFYGTANNKDRAILRTSSGVATNAVYAFYNLMSQELKRNNDYTHIFVSFDAGKKTIRHDFYKQYKEGRKETPDDLISQFAIVREMLTSMGIAHFEQIGYEADDIIASLIEREKNTNEIVIMSSDNDLLQLVDETVSILKPKQLKGEINLITNDNFYEKLGYYPFQSLDYKLIVGDKSDNIEGVKGIGEIGAKKLLKEHQSLDNIYKNLEKIDQKIKIKLENYQNNYLNSKKLITLIKNIEIPIILNNMEWTGDYKAEFIEFLEKYEFTSIINLISNKIVGYEKKILENINKKIERKNDLNIKKYAFLNLILNSDDYHNGALIGIGVYLNGEFNFYTDLENKILFEILTSNTKKVVFNYKKIKYFFNQHGIEINNVVDDVQLLYYVINPSSKSDLYSISQSEKLQIISKNKYLTKTYIQKVKKEGLLDAIESETKAMLILYDEICIPQLYEHENLDYIYHSIEKPYSEVLLKMEENGICVDLKFLNIFEKKVIENIEKTTIAIKSYLGDNINLDSPLQLAQKLYVDMELDKFAKDTSIITLKKIEKKHPVVAQIIEYRKWEKLRSTYIESILKYQKNEKIYTIFDQTETETGRLSSKYPNMQNLASRNEDQRELKKAFIARDGYSLVSVDYSQIEIRIFAHMSNQPEFLNTFNNNEDIHNMTASIIFDIKPGDPITSEQRAKAKSVNFGILYGLKEYGLSQQLGIPIHEAKEFMKIYNERFPNINRFKNEMIQSAFTKGYAKTILGRIRKIPKNLDSIQRRFYERVAINMPIQGTVADIIKLASIKIDKILENNEAFMLLQIHDELIFEIKDDMIFKYKEKIKKIMKEIITLNVKIPVNFRIGKTLYF